MRRSSFTTMLAILVSAVVALTLVCAGGAAAVRADDPAPVVLGPVPQYSGVSLTIRRVGEHRFAGLHSIDQYLPTSRARARAVVRVCNRNHGRVGRVTVRGTGSGLRFHVRYRQANGTDVTSAVVAGTYRTQFLHNEQCVSLRMSLRTTRAAALFDVKVFKVTATPATRRQLTDTVRDKVHAQRRGQQ